MLAKSLSFILEKFLSEFIEPGSWNQENIHIGVWSGNVVLENLVFKNSLFDLLKVPLSLVYGVIGKIELFIPWTNLGNEPVVVTVEKIFLLIGPKYVWDPKAYNNRKQLQKQARLAAAELFASKRVPGNSRKGYRDTAIDWLIHKIVDNVRVNIREVHVRYEDRVSCPSDFCVGITLESMYVQSTKKQKEKDNKNNCETASGKDTASRATLQPSTNKQKDIEELHIDGDNDFHKLIEVNNLSLYWNPLVSCSCDVCVGIFSGRPVVEVDNLMARTIPKHHQDFYERPRHHYIVQPVNIKLFVDASLDIKKLHKTKVSIKIEVSEVLLGFEDNQFRDFLLLSNNFSNFAQLEQFSMFRPKVRVHEDPRAWWQYAFNAVKDQWRSEKMKRLSWRQLHQRRRDKLVYIALWQSKLLGGGSAGLQKPQDTSEVGAFPSKETSIHIEVTNRDHPLYQEELRLAENRQLGSRSNNATSISASIPVSVSPPRTKMSGEEMRPLTPERVRLLIFLEEILSFEDIIFFRSLAEQVFIVTADTLTLIHTFSHTHILSHAHTHIHSLTGSNYLLTCF